jgi:hypothetical protein
MVGQAEEGKESVARATVSSRGGLLLLSRWPTSSRWRRHDMIMPSSKMLQPSIQATPTQVSPISTPVRVLHGPITRNRAKKLQQEMNALLCEIYFNINENYILPKSCILLLLRFTKKDNQNTPRVHYREESCSNLSSMREL